INLFLAIMIASTLSANIVEPKAHLSELYFDSTGNWVIELGINIWDLEVLDSIFIESSAGIATLTSYSLLPGGSYPNFDSIAVITNQNLSSPLFIDKNGDVVRIHSFSFGDPYASIVQISFNSPNAIIPELNEGQSIAYISYGNYSTLCLDNTPTIGTPNDLNGTLGTLKGRVFVNGDPACAGNLKWYSEFMGVTLMATVDEDGYFQDTVQARRYECPETVFCTNPSPNVNWAHNTNGPFVYIINPEEITSRDFYFTTSDIEESEFQKQNISVFSFPNPFSSEISFYIDIPSTEIKNASLEIHTLQGKKIIGFPIQNKSEKITWQPESDIPNGIYLYQLSVEGKICQSGKILKQ
ncbi:MAG: T9SS type A sorting domain-containing protein, partial [Bacteroidota bacterium]|nr:T9SS type A sorting domain-containing protein [Bacteroidota bacterium]